jgi:hypothetical protein
VSLGVSACAGIRAHVPRRCSGCLGQGGRPVLRPRRQPGDHEVMCGRKCGTEVTFQPFMGRTLSRSAAGDEPAVPASQQSQDLGCPRAASARSRIRYSPSGRDPWKARSRASARAWAVAARPRRARAELCLHQPDRVGRAHAVGQGAAEARTEVADDSRLARNRRAGPRRSARRARPLARSCASRSRQQARAGNSCSLEASTQRELKFRFADFAARVGRPSGGWWSHSRSSLRHSVTGYRGLKRPRQTSAVRDRVDALRLRSC